MVKRVGKNCFKKGRAWIVFGVGHSGLAKGEFSKEIARAKLAPKRQEKIKK